MPIASNKPLEKKEERPTTTTPVVQFEGVSVRYRIPRERVSGIKEFAIRWLQRRIEFEDFWAVRDVSFQVQSGEIFGIIGRNGAGKSTILKVMARVLQPTEGRVVMHGKLAPLLELGGGFHPELTGRENVYLNMALLGYKRRHTEELFASVVEFAEIGDFIDAPLRTYSTGMVARLGFAVATSMRPDILLVDEVLSVGDNRFQEKCLDRMFAFQNLGTTIVIVSHGMGAIETFCSRALWLDNGRIMAIGPVSKVIESYINMDVDSKVDTSRPPKKETSPLVARFVEVSECNQDYICLNEIGGIYPAADIFDVAQGTISVWLNFCNDDPGQLAAIFHTDDSRYVLYVEPDFMRPKNRYVHKVKARAGGNRRVFDAFYGTGYFPEASVVVDSDEENPKGFKVTKNKWHLITMTWSGYPEGHIRLCIDGNLLGENSYDSRYDDGSDLPKSIAIGMRPTNWTGELVMNEDGTTVESRPSTSMAVTDGGFRMRDLRLYRRVLAKEEILALIENAEIVEHQASASD